MTRRVPGSAVAALALVALALAAIGGIECRLTWVPSARTAHFETPVEVVAVPHGAAAIARGRHLAESVAVCTVCHGENLGGKHAFDHLLLGRGHTPNLTAGRGGIGASYRVEDWVRALRHGVDRTGRGLLFMPTDHYTHLNDADLGAMIAYFRSLPPVDDDSAGLALTPLARLMIDLGLSGPVVRAAAIDHFAPRPAPSHDAGAYLVEVGGCAFCHGADLNGGRGLEPGAPRAPSLTQGGPLAGRPLADFIDAMRHGRTLSGQPIDPRFMPWQGYRRMTDDEMSAIWRHLGHGTDNPAWHANRGAASNPGSQPLACASDDRQDPARAVDGFPLHARCRPAQAAPSAP